MVSINVLAAQNYRQVLLSIYQQRSQKNQKYSLRAFARDIDITSSRLSEILGKKEGLSKAKAGHIAKNLQFSKVETEFFCNLVESEHGRSQTQKNMASEKLKELRKKKSYQNLPEDIFHWVSDWYHNAILELITLPRSLGSSQWIAKSLNLPLHQVELAMQRLARLKLIRWHQKKWIPCDENTITANDIPSKAIRNYHKQILRKAMEAIDNQSIDQREMSSLIFAFPSHKLHEAKLKVRQFTKEMSELAAKESDKDEVYAFNLQFFKMTQDSHVKETQK